MSRELASGERAGYAFGRNLSALRAGSRAIEREISDARIDRARGRANVERSRAGVTVERRPIPQCYFGFLSR